MTENKSYERFELHRHIAKADLPDDDWAATPSIPDESAYEIRDSDRAGNGIAFAAVLVDADGDAVAPASCSLTFEVQELISTGYGTQIAVGGDLIGPYAPFKEVILAGENAPGMGDFVIRIAAASGIPAGATHVDIYVKEV